MELPLLTLWFVCALGTAVLAAADPADASSTPRRAWIQAAAAAAAFAACAWWIRQPFAPSSAAVALTVAVVAATQVTRTPRRPYALTTAGALAGIWSGVLQQEGLPLALSIIAAGLVPAISAALRRRPEFAPSRLREEALLLLVLLAVTAAAVPGVIDGWQAAVNLTIRSGSPPAGAAESAMPGWTLVVATSAFVSGSLFSLWSRR